MKITTRLLLIAALFALALPLIFTGTVSARFASDGAVQDGVTGGWKAPTDGVCVVSLDDNGDMVIDGTITNARDCAARLVDVTAVTSGDTLANVCGNTTKNTAGLKYAAPGSSTCVTVDTNLFINGSISLKDLDRSTQMCEGKSGQLANKGVTFVKNTADGTAAKCIAYGWLYRGQDADGAPLAFGTTGTAAGIANAGFCYTKMTTDIAAGSCPSLDTNVRVKYGYSVTGSNCDYNYGINGPLAANITAIDGTVTAAGTTVDLSAKTMGECLAGGYTWNNWVPNDGTEVHGATIAIFDHNKRTSGSDREGCLHCHGLDQSRGYVERFKESYLKTGHKNMLRKVTAGKNWAGPDGIVYTAHAEGNLDFATATADVSEGAGMPLLYIFGEWMAPAPAGLDVIVNNGGSAKYNGGSNYSCAPCHTTGWSNTATATAGLCSISSNTTQAACTTAGGTWVPTTGAQGVIGQEPTASFPGITFSGAGNWDLDGITCTRCHGSSYPTPTGLAATEVAVGGHQNSVWDDGQKINNLCYGCHQSPAKTSNGTGLDIDTANPQNIPVKLVGSDREFSGHVLGNSFLNSPHAKFTGTITPNALGKWSIAGGTYDSTFKGYACYTSSTGTSPALTKADGSFIHDKADCEAIYGAGAWKIDLASSGSGAAAGNCTTCHDVHNSLFVEGQTHHPLRRECETCHEDTAGNGYAAASVPQIDAAMLAHPQGTNTPWDTSKFVNACETCHMPKATSGGFPMHLWRINTSDTYSTFPTVTEFNAGMKIANASADGSYAGAVWVDVDLSCGQCHYDGTGGTPLGLNYVAGNPVLTKAGLAAYADALHDGSVPRENTVCTTCHSTINQGVNHHVGSCNMCHSFSSATGHYTKPAAAPNSLATTLVRDTVNTYCLQCHSSDQGTKHAIVVSGTGDNHHNGSGTTTARSIAGCLYCHSFGKTFGDATTEVMLDQVAPGSCSGACHSSAQASANSHHKGVCLTCHLDSRAPFPGDTDGVIGGDSLDRNNAAAYCQACHATEQNKLAGGTTRALVISGAGDNHHRGSSTSTARSVAGCFYCHGNEGGVAFGGAATEAVTDAAAAGLASPCQACHGVVQSGADQNHHAGDCLTCHLDAKAPFPGDTDGVIGGDHLDRNNAAAYCQACHATEQNKLAGGTTRALVISGAGDNHHRGSGTSTARSVAGCFYCHGSEGGVPFGATDTEVKADQPAGSASPCQACHGVVQSGDAQNHHAGDCLTCHTVGSPIVPGGTDPALFPDLGAMNRDQVNGYCLTCHASQQGSFRGIVVSGTGDNHHNGSGTTTARSVAGCLYCHGDEGGVKFGTATTEVMEDGAALGNNASCSGACHSSSQPGSGTHHTGAGLTPVSNTLCLACHDPAGNGAPGVTDPAKWPVPTWVDCSACHAGAAQATNGPTAAHHVTSSSCTTCHDHAGIAPAADCSACHSDKSVSFMNHHQGGATPDSCADCHTQGGIKPTIADSSSCTSCHTVSAPSVTVDAVNARLTSGLHVAIPVPNAAPVIDTISASLAAGTWDATLSYTAHDTDVGDTVTVKSVNWGDGTVDTSLTHTYSSAGIKNITLIVTDTKADTSGSTSVTPELMTISGTVTKSGVGQGGVTITRTGGVTTGTDATGAYSFAVAPGSYDLAATKAGEVYSPASITAAAGSTGNDFTSTVWTLTVNRTAATGTNGAISSADGHIGCGTGCTGTSYSYNGGASVTLTATPSSGTTVTLTGACTGTATAGVAPGNVSCTLTMDAAKTVNAAFTVAATSKPMLTVATNNANGKVTGLGINCKTGAAAPLDNCTEAITLNNYITLQATSTAVGKAFVNWTGCTTPLAGNKCQMKMTGDKSVTANFAP